MNRRMEYDDGEVSASIEIGAFEDPAVPGGPTGIHAEVFIGEDMRGLAKMSDDEAAILVLNAIVMTAKSRVPQ